jgi:hypothetical protein
VKECSRLKARFSVRFVASSIFAACEWTDRRAARTTCDKRSVGDGAAGVRGVWKTGGEGAAGVSS